MSDDKKDLTRIEDLGEYIHELNAEDDFQVPDLPDESAEAPDFASGSDDPFATPTEESTSDFASSEESTGFETNDFGSSDFGSTDFGTEESEATPETNEFSTTDFETSDFGSSDFETSDFSSSEFNAEESPAFGTEEETNFETSDFGVSEEASASEVSDFPSLEEETPALESMPEPEPEPTPTSEPEPDPLPDPEPVMEVAPTPAPTQEYKAPENFADLKKFAESTSFTGMGAEGNPSFSVLIKNVRYIEDVTDILALMKELGLQADSEEQMKNRLMRGSLLVPRISEFAAVLLSHKLRRFDIDIQVGLSDEIHPPKHKEEPETGLVSKFNLYQNQSHHFQFDDPKLEISQIIVSATPTLEGHQVVRYLGVASEHKILDGHVVEDENSTEVPRHYQELAQKLKAHALKAHSNAVVGLNYQLTPLPSEYGSSSSKYRLTCTGNLVWVNKL